MHLAFILDGNRRWATEQGLPAIEGHRRGLLTVRDTIVEACLEHNVDVLSLYCFSTENWNRSKMEVSSLMMLFQEMIDTSISQYASRGIAVRHIGRKDRLPASLLASIDRAEHSIVGAPKLTVCLALDYGGQDEIVRAVQRVPQDELGALTTQTFTSYLDTTGLAPVDLLIRTGGDQRISNFLLWQSAYAELLFLPKFLPALTKVDIEQCLSEYEHRQRRFGK